MSVESALERLEALLGDMRDRMERIEERLKPEPTCLTYPQAAKRIGVGVTKLKEMVKRGDLRKSFPLKGGAPMITLTEILRASVPEAERPKVERQQRKAAWVPIPIGKKR